MKNNSTVSARQIALDLLLKAEKSKQFSNIALDKALEAKEGENNGIERS